MFAIVAVRLMPSLNRISTAWGTIKFYVPTFDSIYDDLVNCERMDEEHQELEQGEPIYFKGKIEVRNISFSYENAQAQALQSVALYGLGKRRSDISPR